MTYDVAVVGLGPVGATLANLLAIAGLRVLVLEREQAVYALPRAIHFDGECMRILQAVGIAEALEPHLFPSPGMRFVDSKGGLLIDWSRPQGIGPQGWNASYRFHQPQLEAMLREALQQRANVDVRLGCEVVAIEQGADSVALGLRDASPGGSPQGKPETVTSRYVVGCDGARSCVRNAMGVTLDDLESHERWLVVDVVLSRERPDLGDYSVQFCNPARPATYVRGVGARRRWELMLSPGEDAAEMTRPDRLWELLSPWVTPEDGVVERPAVYTFHSVVAKRWRAGCLIIAGDAAHQTPPFMGQGMCAGLRDASNLAWKLAAVAQGRAADSLLDTYESERLPHAREFIETAVRLGQVIQTTDVAAAQARDEAMLNTPQVFSTPQPSLGPGAHDAGPLGGRLSEQPLLESGQRLDDEVGYRCALLQRSGEPVGHDARGRDVSFVRPSPAVDAYLERCGARAMLVRPDRYIAGTADNATDLASLLQWAPVAATSPSRPSSR